MTFCILTHDFQALRCHLLGGRSSSRLRYSLGRDASARRTREATLLVSLSPPGLF